MSEQEEPIMCAGCGTRPVSTEWNSDIYCTACLHATVFDLVDDKEEYDEEAE